MVARHRQPRAASALLRAAAAFLPAAALLGASRGAPAWRLSPGVPLAVAALARPLCGLRPRTAPAGTLESAVRARALRRGPKDVDRRAAKIKGLAPTEMARRVALALQERSWFVSGDIAIELFDDEFLFVDRPQGKDQAAIYISMEDGGGGYRIEGPMAYATTMNLQYNQDDTRMDILDVKMTGKEQFVITWRLEGKTSVGLSIKPHVRESTFRIGPKGLVDYQRDDSDVPEWDLQASAITPWMPGLKPPAPPVDRQFVVPDVLEPYKP